ncbi:MAG: TdeIII family type II restriction endonuclease [Candidatus Heimdallarchaeaceae archaeon]
MTLLNVDTQRAIKNHLRNFLQSKIETYQDPEKWNEEEFKLGKPFNDALIPARFWFIPKFLHSLRTTLGQNCIENIAEYIAKQFSDEATIQKRIEKPIPSKQKHKIQQIVDELYLSSKDARKRGQARSPNWSAELNEILSIKDTNEELDTVIADLYMRRGDQEYFFELKSSKPNKGEVKVAKYNLLRIQAMYKGRVHTFFAMYDNPWIERSLYRHSFTKLIFDVENSPAVLIAKEFWDFIGTKGVYEEVIDLFREVGLEYRDKIYELLGISP